jgi:hypothetical protein
VSDEHQCDGKHEHNDNRVHLELTPAGLRLNVLGLVGELFVMLQTGRYDEATDLADLAGSMLSAAYLGHFDWLDNGYQEAAVLQFSSQLDDPAAVAAALKEEDQSE